jgi:DNA-binding beta-propeller fold protein YncE
MTLALHGHIDLPPHVAGGFDHGDVHLASGRVFIAHTANGTVDIVDGERLAYEASVGGCAEASGVVCAQDDGGLVFAAARGAGKVLVLDPTSCALLREIAVGPKPNGLAWDPRRRHLLAADVEELTARLVDAATGELLARVDLPGRPRWCVYDPQRDRLLVNIRDPACVLALAAGTMAERSRIPVSAAGPHGLDVDLNRGRAFVACDAGVVVALDLETGRELARVPIAGEPDVAWYSAAHDRLYVAVGQPGVVDVIDCRRLVLAGRVTTEPGAHTTAYDRRRQRLYVFLPGSCRAVIFVETHAA